MALCVTVISVRLLFETLRQTTPTQRVFRRLRELAHDDADALLISATAPVLERAAVDRAGHAREEPRLLG